MAYYNINFYQHFFFTILNDDNIIIKEDIKLWVGDIIKIKGNENNTDVNNKE